VKSRSDNQGSVRESSRRSFLHFVRRLSPPGGESKGDCPNTNLTYWNSVSRSLTLLTPRQGGEKHRWWKSQEEEKREGKREERKAKVSSPEKELGKSALPTELGNASLSQRSKGRFSLPTELGTMLVTEHGTCLTSERKTRETLMPARFSPPSRLFFWVHPAFSGKGTSAWVRLAVGGSVGIDGVGSALCDKLLKGQGLSDVPGVGRVVAFGFVSRPRSWEPVGDPGTQMSKIRWRASTPQNTTRRVFRCWVCLWRNARRGQARAGGACHTDHD